MSALSTALRGSILLLAGLPAAAQLPPLFPGQDISLVGPGSHQARLLRSGDVNLDGVTDLVVVSDVPATSQTELGVLLGRPEGGYETPLVSPMAGTSLADAVVCDLGGDGFPDVAGCTSNQRMVVAHGTGDGSFVASYEYFAGNGALVHVAVADLDNDGFGDVISAASGPGGTLDVNFSDGAGGYLATQAFATLHVVASLGTGDLDSDGWTDLVAADGAGKLTVLRNDGTGGLLAPHDITTPGLPVRAVLAALDGDAELDVLVVSASGSSTLPGTLQSWLGDGAGTLLLGASTPIGINPAESDVKDMDADGDPDVAVWCGTPSLVDLLLNDGAAHFGLSDTLPIGTELDALVLADASGDALPDVVAMLQPPQQVQPPPPAVAMTYTASAPGVIPSGDSWFNGTSVPVAIATGFVNGDGAPDVVVVSKPGPALATLLAGGGGLQTTPVVSPDYVVARAVGVGDLDGDGLADAVTAPEFNVAVAAYLQLGRSRGDGSFYAPLNLGLSFNSTGAHGLVLPDFDGDGSRDIAAIVPGSPSTLVSFRNTGRGALAFGAPDLQPTGKFAQFLASGDLDDDGLDDVVVVEPKGGVGFPGSLFALLGSVSGHLQPGPDTSLPFEFYALGPQGIALGDVNLDGRLDAAVGAMSTGEIALAYGDGAGGLLATAWGPAMEGSIAIAVSDVNGDGWSDVLHSPDSSVPEVIVRLGDGSGGLQAPQGTPCADGVQDIAVADVTQDGRPDLLVACKALDNSQLSRVQLLPGVAEPFTWKDLGFALAGETGAPALQGTGELVAGTPGFVRLTEARPVAPAALFVSAAATPTPFKGGTLVPLPPLLLLGLSTNAQGLIDLPWASWPSSSPGASWFFQFAVQDPGAPHGVALSNAISGTEPD
jgi:FG-GAP-like repeat